MKMLIYRKARACFIFFSVSVQCTILSSAQDNDTLLNQQIDSLYDKAWTYSRSDPTQGLAILKQIEQLHDQQDTAYRPSVICYYYGVFYKNLNEWEKSEEYFNKYEAYHSTNDDTLRMALAIMAKANLHSDRGDLTRSAESATKALKFYTALRDTHGIIRASSKLGYLMTEVDRFDAALSYHRNSNALAQAIGNKQEEVISFTNIGLNYEKQNLLDSAFQAYEKAYNIGETLESAYDKVINRYNMATILKKQGRIDEAMSFVKLCISLADSIDIPSLRVAGRKLFAEIMLIKGDLDTAIPLLDSLARMLDHDLGLRDQMEIYELRAIAYQQKGDYKTAFEDYKTYKQLNDSLLGKESRDRLNELEVQYETERKEQQIAYLDLQNRTSLALIVQKDRTILIGGIGLVLITIFATVLFFLFKSYQRQKKELSKALQDKDLLLREIHHRVKNNLQIVSSLLSLQGRSLDDETALQAINAGKSRVRSMALIHQSLYQRENLTGVNVKEYFEKLTNELFRTYDVDEDRIHLKLEIQPLELDVDTLVPLGLIVNELITNALKYAFPEGRSGSLEVSLMQKKETLEIEVADNGVGYDPTAVRDNSFGQKLIHSLVQQLKGKLTLNSSDGTIARLSIRHVNLSDSV